MDRVPKNPRGVLMSVMQAERDGARARAEKAEAQRDALLEASKALSANAQWLEDDPTLGQCVVDAKLLEQLDAAIRKVNDAE